ncbi:MAG: hypothetical protein Q9M11_03410 [Mariprofundaceae bacterium]|nr:hypothetical protein [Mariprofundaceae bacterium]
MNILILKLPGDCKTILLASGLIDNDDTSMLRYCMDYLIASAVAIRVTGTMPDILDYILINDEDRPTPRRSGEPSIDDVLADLMTVLEWYAPHVLNELVLANIPSPYIVTVDGQNFTIANKEEYNI